MKNPCRTVASIVFATLTFVLVTRSAVAQDPVKVAPSMCKVLLENDRVRVLDFWVKPGGKIPMHSHPAAVTYFITTGKMKTTMPDGKVTEMEPKAGEARWAEAVTHANENIGTTEAHVIVVEIKEPVKK
ncbi:MAG: cupin domain-containing protein [candidate division KSB1 bacterium]|nr:cupin domain-containing protein [candidate division KSB1 bacterium]MDZ7367898.1 cupin domain-containing protein [candidate division KSB1 bacterium]